MKTEQLKPILHDLTSHLVNILVKLEPELKNHHWAKNPSFLGIRFLIEKALPLLNRASQNEIGSLYNTTKTVTDYFKLQINSTVFATCYIFIHSAIVDEVQYEFDFDQIMQYFQKNYQQVRIKAKFSESYPFDHIMIDQQIDGFTKHTFLRLQASKKSTGEIKIYEERNPSPNESDLLADLDNELSFGRKELIDAIENELGSNTLSKRTRDIKQEFEKFATELSLEYQKLIETFETLLNILKSEIEIRKNSRPASFIRLPFNEKKNQEIIDFLFKELNGLCFNTTKENFTKIFKPDRTFTKILWEKEPKTLVYFFTGFNFIFDGREKEFIGVMDEHQNKFSILADKFHIERKSDKMPLATYFYNISQKTETPRELKKFSSLIDALKNGWYK